MPEQVLWIEPEHELKFKVVFQPCELEPAGYKHKFMVQALYAPEGDVNVDALWKDVDNTKLMDTKLRCTFEMPAGADSGNQNDEEEEEKASHAKFSEGDAAADAEPVMYEYSDTTAYMSTATPEENRGADSTARVQQETSQLRKENVHLKDELDRLKRQLKSREASGGSMGTAMQSASPPAIPMVYIVLALVAVLIGLIMGKFIL